MRPNAAAGAAGFRFEFQPIAANPGSRRDPRRDFFARGVCGFVLIVDRKSKTIWGPPLTQTALLINSRNHKREYS